MIEHPRPTNATVKLLYAHAVCCAHLTCREPLYREDGLSGTWALNSRICHICARSEGGPRWDPNQSPQSNRSAANLLLMCTAHASAIDDPKALGAYPVALLQEWKADQVEKNRLRRIGWPLTKAMAEEAITASFLKIGLVISNSVLHLRGEGGRGRGAGGGGGPAIGPGSRGGHGGKGGDIIYSDGNKTSEDELGLQSPDVDLDRPFGSGGGGASALGPESTGGDGGNGGEEINGVIWAEAGDVFEAQVGAGGKGSRLPGQHSEPGGDSVVVVKSADGKIKHVLRARGGSSTKSGELLHDWVTISEADLADGFQISTLLAANAVDRREGLLFVLGGGWSTFWPQNLPFDAIWTFICVASWTRLAPGPTRGVQLCLSTPDRREVSRIALPLPSDMAKTCSCSWLCSLGAPLDQEGLWRVSVISGDILLSDIGIRVELLTGQGGVQP